MKRILCFLLLVSMLACLDKTAKAQPPGSGLPNVTTLPTPCQPSGSNSTVYKTTTTVGPYYCGSDKNWHALTGGTVGAAFSALTSGTNTALAGVVGSGASLNFSGTGFINVNRILGVTVVANAATFLGAPSSANLLAALTTKTGTGLAMFGTSPTASGLTLSDVATGTQCLHANSSGVVSGTGADCGAGSGGSPGGASTNVQFNNSSAFGGDNNFVYDSANKAVGIGGAVITGSYLGTVSAYGNVIMRSASADLFSNGIISQKRGTTGNINGAVGSGSELGHFTSQGWNGSAYTANAAGIIHVAAESWNGTANGARMQFYTTPVGTVPNKYSAVLTDIGSFGITSNAILGFSSSSSDPTAFDSGLARASANTVCVNQGGLDCTTRGDLNLRNVNFSGSATGGDTTHSGLDCFNGITSGTVCLGAADVAGTAIVYIMPSTNGTAGQFMEDSGAVTCPTYVSTAPALCHQMIWAAAGGGGGGGSVFTGSTGSTSTFSATPTFSLADVSVKSPIIFQPGAMTANVTAVTFTNKTAGARFIIAWLQDGTGGRTINYGSASGSVCQPNPTANITTYQAFIIAADGTTVVGTGCADTSGEVNRAAEIAAPGTPLASTGVCWFDSTNHIYSCKQNNSATVSNTVVPSTCTNQVISSIGAGGAITCHTVVPADMSAAAKTRGIGFTVGDPTNSGALTTSNTAYFRVPVACTITGYSLMVDATDTTLRVKFWKVASGTAIPTVSNSISTSGLGVPSGTAVVSTTTSDFTTTTVTADDLMAMNVSVANTAKMVSGELTCVQ